MASEKFNLEKQYQLYLERVKLKEEEMHPIQRVQIKQCFYGAIGQILILLRDEVGELPEDEGAEQMQDFLNQVGNFFYKENNRTN